MSEGAASWFPNRAAGVVFIIVFALWAASEVFNTFRFRRQMPGTQRHDRGSYWVVFVVIWGSLISAFVAREFERGVFHGGLQWVGIGLAAAGVAFREWAVLLLGSAFTVTVRAAAGQTLITQGPYRWLRHPSYSGSILSLVGFALALGTWIGAAAAFALSVGGYLYRIRVEEKAMLDAFGDAYRDYMQHTWRLFPGL